MQRRTYMIAAVLFTVAAAVIAFLGIAGTVPTSNPLYWVALVAVIVLLIADLVKLITAPSDATKPSGSVTFGGSVRGLDVGVLESEAETLVRGKTRNSRFGRLSHRPPRREE